MKIGKFHINRDKKHFGKPMWIINYGIYMYGPDESLLLLIKYMIDNWNSESNIVG